MALPPGFFTLGRPVGSTSTPTSNQIIWTAEINGTLQSLEAFGDNLDGIFFPEEFRFPRIDWLLVPGLNISRPGIDAPMQAVIGGGWIGTDFDDQVSGSAGSMRLLLAHGNDSASGSATTDWIYGGAGNDTIDGQDGIDFIDGGSGDDVVVAGTGDIIDGQSGSDTIILGDTPSPGGFQVVGPAFVVRLGDATQVNYEFVEGYVDVTGTGADQIGLFSIENVVGSGRDDDIRGSSVANRLDGQGGDDTLDGLDGNDTLMGGNGFDILAGGDGADLLDGGNDDDQLWGGFGYDTIIGGAGVDTYLVEQPLFDGDPDAILPTQADVDLGRGTAEYLLMFNPVPTETVSFWNSDSPNPSTGTLLVLHQGLGYHTLSGIENATGGALTDRLRGSAEANLLDGGGSGDILEGFAGNDTIIGGGGNDIMRGGDGFDTADYSGTARPLLVQLWNNRAQSDATGIDTLTDFERVIGGDGNDTLVGASANEELKGEVGNDLIFGNSGDDTLWGGQGADTLRGEQGADRLFGDWANDVLLGDEGADTLFGFFGDDVLYGWTGRDRLLGEQGNDSLYGEQDDDFLGGLEGNDFLIGGDGNDVIFGDDGNDFLGGKAGADVLVGGLGSDTMWGDAGADLFIFRPEDIQAGVTDFIRSFAGSGPEADTIRLAMIPPASVSVVQVGADAAIRLAVTGGGFAEIIVQGAAATDVGARLAYF